MSTLPPPIPVIAHTYTYNPGPSALTAYETGPPTAPNSLIFIGGLFDGPGTVDYIRNISSKFYSDFPEWSLFDIRISSSFTGFGHGSLDRDVDEIAKLVSYLRHLEGKKEKGKVILMGHSTGSQDCIHYACTKDSIEPVDGYILQAPCSDREGLAREVAADELAKSLKQANVMIATGQGREMMPRFTGSMAYFPPITAYRWNSLAVVGGDDDYFSSDLSSDQLRNTFGKFEKPVLVLHSGEDQYMSPSIDKLGLVRRFTSSCRDGVASELSGVIPGANHQVHDRDAQIWLADVVVKFLRGV